VASVISLRRTALISRYYASIVPYEAACPRPGILRWAAGLHRLA
jgi:hypothetical protein